VIRSGRFVTSLRSGAGKRSSGGFLLSGAESIPRQLATDHWNHPPPLFGNAVDLFDVARTEDFQVSRQPAVGEKVVYGSSYGVFGPIATVIVVEPGRYEMIEQNFIDFNPNLGPHCQTFDLRSIAWPHPAVVGFVVAPP
jgi:hypothetical protein